MAQYYYTVAALPYLNFDAPLPLSKEEFLDFCKSTLTEEDWNLLESVSLFGEEKTSLPLLTSWHKWERAFRSELARLRAGKLGMDTESLPRVSAESARIQETARLVFNEPSPAQAELLILKTYWDILEDLEVNHFFDLEKLIVYYLKLQVLELRAARNRIEGEKNFTSLYHRIRDAQQNPIMERWSTQ
ncbi:MAG: DUF2764 family protein [Spirochaetales bacterium]